MPPKRVPVRMFGPPRAKPTPSPIQDPMGLMPLLEEMRAMYEFIKEYAPMIKSTLERATAIKQGMPGAPGIQGVPGNAGRAPTQAEVEAAVAKLFVQPAPGPKGDAADPKEVAAILEPKIVKAVKKLAKPGLAGKNAEPVSVEVLAGAMLEHIKKTGVLTIEHVPEVKKLLEARVGELRNQLAGKQYGKDTWARGGGDTVEAGMGVTITNTPGGTKRISAAGGVGAWQTPAEAPDGIIVVFTVTLEPTDVIADGIQFFAGAGYSYGAGQITFDNPPAQYVRYR